MSDCFISHSSQDAPLAAFVHSHLRLAGANPFIAPMDVPAGSPWAEIIRQRLSASSVVLFLASKRACSSPAVLLELGGAWLSGKKIIPVVWDMPPEHLPAWIRQRQAVDLRGRGSSELMSLIAQLAYEIRRQKMMGALLLAGLGAALVYMHSN